jgi:hypothetical protein
MLFVIGDQMVTHTRKNVLNRALRLVPGKEIFSSRRKKNS